MPRLRPPSPALCVALLALFVALGGTTWAALLLPLNSVGTRQLMTSAVNLPAGSDVLSAKGQIDTFHNDQIVECDLIAGSDVDRSFGQGGDNHQSQILGSSLVHSFATAGTVNLSCSAFNGATLSQVRVTAVTVGSVSSAP
jgi:hypothetical protein